MHTRTTLLALAWAPLALVPSRGTDLPAQNLPVYGGSGGSSYSRSCGADRVLTGFRYRSGLVIDAIGLLCRPVNSDGTLGAETTVGTLAGGGGGTAGSTSCSRGKVVTGASIRFNSYVEQVMYFCRDWIPSTRTFGASSTEESKVTGGSSNRFTQIISERCELAAQPAHGIRGREASVVDAIGLVCDEP